MTSGGESFIFNDFLEVVPTREINQNKEDFSFSHPWPWLISRMGLCCSINSNHRNPTPSLCICPSQAGVLSKRLDGSSWFSHGGILQ